MDSPEISLSRESARHIREGLKDVSDIWRHEGLKKGIEAVMDTASRQEASRWILQKIAGPSVDDDRLTTNVGGIELTSPVGIAPGWDKTGKTVRAWQELGAGHITPGGITYYSQKGNRMARLRTFDERVGDHGTSKSLNAYGFPSKGVVPVTYNIGRQREAGGLSIPVIAQLTLNKEMYEESNRHLIPHMLQMTAKQIMAVANGINLGLSSPNTLGMRDAQAYEFLYECIMAVKEVVGDEMPLGFKGDGDGGEERLDMYCRLVETTGLNYLELINTTALQRIKAKYGAEDMPGGLAGADPEYQDLALRAVEYAYNAVGDKADIMGMGGVNSADRAMRMFEAGASGVGINTSVRQLGLSAVSSITRGVRESLDDRPFGTTLANVIGMNTERGPKIPLAA